MFNDPTFWFMVAFLLFVGLVGKKIWQFLIKQLDLHKQSIENEIAEAVKLHKKAQEFLKEIHKKNQQVGQHAEEILAHARFEAERLQAAAKKEMEDFVIRQEKLATEKIAFAERKALKDIHTRVIKVGLEVAEKILPTIIDRKNADKLIDQALEEIKQDVQWNKRISKM
jgi:F-type H+-transporting ATPase subunit b